MSGVPYAIAFNALAFVALGFDASLTASDHPAYAALLSGTTLLIGGFFGLLFGYPHGVAANTLTAPAVPATPVAPLVPPAPAIPVAPLAPPAPAVPALPKVTPQTNLLAQASTLLGTVLAGFTLAKGDDALTHFKNICEMLAPVIGTCQIAGLTILYFLCVGFFAGLLLPTYFMQEILGPTK